MSIMVTGATGQLGSLIMEKLEKYVPASQVIACVRQPDKAVNFLEKGFEVRFGDYDQLDTLIDAFTGVTTLLLISSSHTDDKIRLHQHTQVIHAAKRPM